MKKYPLLSISMVLVIFIQLTSCSGEKHLSTSTPEPVKTSTIQPTVTQMDLPTKTATITSTDLPTKTATITPTETPFPVERDSDGNFLPKPIAFLDTETGKIKEIKDLEEPNSTINKAIQEAKNQLNIKDDSGLQTACLDIVCENGRRTYMVVRAVATGKEYSAFVKDENGFYLPPDSVGELVLLPLKTVSKEVQQEDGSMDQQELLGFDVHGDLLIPPTFSYSEKKGEFTYIDPKTGEKIVLIKETNTAPKMLAMLKGEKTVEKPLTPEQEKQVKELRDRWEKNYRMSTDSIDISFDDKGLVIYTDKISGRLIGTSKSQDYLNINNTTGRDQLENGSWVFNPNFTKKLATEGLEKTDMKPTVRWGVNRPGTGVDKYGLKIFDKFNSDNPGLVEQLVGGTFSRRYIFLYAHPDGSYSWGAVIGKKYDNESWSGRSDERYLIYVDSKGEIKYIQIYYPNYLVYG